MFKATHVNLSTKSGPEVFFQKNDIQIMVFSQIRLGLCQKTNLKLQGKNLFKITFLHEHIFYVYYVFFLNFFRNENDDQNCILCILILTYFAGGPSNF